MAYENIWEKNGVYRKYSNNVTGEDIRQAMEEVHGHRLFDSIHYVINDFLDIKECNLSTTEVVAFAALDRAAALTNPNINIAIVATEKTIQTLATLYGDLISRSPYSSEVFINLEEARNWAT